ncbi:MAG TPA: hypothetical protein VME43_28325 [Bryobacteraceae bacterium]|nr:hypothetical protein [Bryobacteraceae bacterium]
MLNFRDFEAGPDPFGRKFQVLFKWLQTAISIRHADTVDVKFILMEKQDTAPAGGESPAAAGNAAPFAKTIALPHANLLGISRESHRPMDDPWCARLAMMHLRHLVETGEDMEKDLVTVPPAELSRYATELARMEGQKSQAA